MHAKASLATAVIAGIFALISALHADDEKAIVDPIARDYKLLEGQWELLHGNEGKGPPTIRSVKEVKGNKETLRRYTIADGQMFHEHKVEFTLSESGDVRIFTFYGVGGNPEQGLSFVYKVDEDDFYDIPRLLQGGEFRNYQATPTIWHWKRVKEEEKDGDAEKKTDVASKSRD